MSLRKMKRQVAKAQRDRLAARWNAPETREMMGYILIETECPLKCWPTIYTLHVIGRGRERFEYTDSEVADKIIELMEAEEIQDWMRQFRTDDEAWNEKIEAAIAEVEKELEIVTDSSLIVGLGLDSTDTAALKAWTKVVRQMPEKERRAHVEAKVKEIDEIFDSVQGMVEARGH